MISLVGIGRAGACMPVCFLALFLLSCEQRSLTVLAQGREELIQVAFDDGVETMQSQANSVIGHTILRVIVGPNFFGAVPATHHTATLIRDRLVVSLLRRR